MDPLVDRIEQVLGLRRGVAVSCVLASFFLALTLVALLLGPETARQARSLSEDLPEVVGELSDLPVVGDTLERNDVPQKVEDWLNDLPETLAGPDANLGDRAESILSGLLAALSTGLIVIMLLLDGDRLVSAFQRLDSRPAPAPHRPGRPAVLRDRRAATSPAPCSWPCSTASTC